MAAGFRSTLIVTLSVLWACGQAEKLVEISTPFNSKEAEFILKDGNSTIVGQGFLMKRDGEIVTCSGSNVFLIPKTKYADERMHHLYGNTSSGVNYSYYRITFPNNSEYERLVRTAPCDEKGHFEFTKIPAGRYYLATYVFWGNEDSRQGGSVMKAVSVEPGEEEFAVLTG